MEKKNLSNIILFFLFIILIVIVSAADVLNGSFLSTIKSPCSKNLSEKILNNSTFEKPLMDVNGMFFDSIGMYSYYNSIGIYVTEDKYIVSPSQKTSTDYEFEQIVSFDRYLKGKGIKLIYFNQPTKYTDDSMFYADFGTETYSNRNADLFMERISGEGISCLDLRNELKKDGKNIRDMFYRTDHHWTVESGLWAAGKMASALNEYADYNIDLSVFDKSNYTLTSYRNCWIGEQGTKLSKAFIGTDDFTSIEPAFETSFYFPDTEETGSFDRFINKGIYSSDELYASRHYSYNLLHVQNNNIGEGRILMLCDSYAYVCEPFLSLGVNEIYPIILRGYKGSIKELIESGEFDTIIICYAQFMIGAHDNPESANYNMFDFNR